MSFKAFLRLIEKLLCQVFKKASSSPDWVERVDSALGHLDGLGLKNSSSVIFFWD
jgi:hypothetical protein